MENYKAEIEKIYNCTDYSLPSCADKNNIALYGAGKMGKMAIDIMKKSGLAPKYFVDSKAHGTLEGYKIISSKEIPQEDKNELTFVVCVVTAPFSPIEDFLREQGCKSIIHFYDYSENFFPEVMSNGWTKFDFSESDKEEVLNVLKSLEHDPASVADYLRFLWWRIRRKEVIYNTAKSSDSGKYFKEQNFPLLDDNEVFVDGGAYYGEIINDFIKAVSGKFNKIYAFEPDLDNINIFKKNVDESNLGMFIYNEALSDFCGETYFIDKLGYASKLSLSNYNKKIKVVTLDSTAINPTIIKLHVEGSELKVLNGAKNTILKNKPVLMVLADHNEDGLYKIAKFLIQLEKYKIYFHLHDYCGNSAIFYAYPKRK